MVTSRTPVPNGSLDDAMVRDALEQARSLISGVVSSVTANLEAQVESALTSRERQSSHELLLEVRKVAPQLVNEFMAQFRSLLSGAPTKSAAPAFDPNAELTLVEDSQMQEEVEVRQIIQQIEAKSDWEIRDLNARMSALRGESVVRAEDNPLRPEVFGKSLQKAVQAVPLGGDDRLTMLRAFGGAMSKALKDTYSAYNERLKARNVQPVGFRMASAAPRGGGFGGSGAPGAVQPAGQGPAWQDTKTGQPGFSNSAFHNLPQNALGPGTNAAVDPVYANALQSLMRGGFAPSSFGPQDDFQNSVFGQATRNEQLQGILQQMGMPASVFVNSILPGSQAEITGSYPAVPNLIAQYRDDLQQAATRPIERLTIDVVSMMFDHILGDKKLLSGIRAALGRLQIPVLRAALADPSIFSSRSHPTRKLINRIASYSVGFEHESDPQYVRFSTAVNVSVETIMANESESSTIYTTELDGIEVLIAEINAEREVVAGQAVAALERAELRTVLRSSLAHHIAGLVANVDVEDYLANFMREQWTQVLVEAILVYGENSENTRYFKQVGSDLIWSVQPKTIDEDRQHLIKLLPRLVKSIREGLSLIEWPIGEERELFARLMASHARAIRRDLDVKPMSQNTATELRRWKDSVASAWGSTLDVESPHALADLAVKGSEKAAAALIEEADVASSQFGSTQYPAAETAGENSISDAAAQPVAAEAENALSAENWQENVIKGNWYQLLLHSEWIKVQLFWKSPKGLFFMFSSNVGGKSHSLTFRALDKLRREGAFALLEGEGESLIDRAVANVMKASATNSGRAGPVN